MREAGDPRKHTVPEMPWHRSNKETVAYLIALQLIHHKPTGNDIHDALVYRDLYPQLKRWLEYLE